MIRGPRSFLICFLIIMLLLGHFKSNKNIDIWNPLIIWKKRTRTLGQSLEAQLEKFC